MNQQWLAWWHSGYWQTAHESWRQDSWFALPEARRQALARMRAGTIGGQWSVQPSPVAPPQLLLLSLLALSEPQKIRLLALVEAICGAETALTGEEKIWCRRLSRGIRPESWLPEALLSRPMALALLQALYPDCWTRLRMAFPREAALACPATPPDLPARRLQPIWEAALWRCQSGEHNHVAA
ncbi:hypothetical protein ACQE32_19085 [Pantoea sp. FN0302]|uniref:hypothetical protein n=1 Tax=Pantoea sp. FN0302 TaxID=3418558 RepID=UPI003CEA60AF